MNKYEHVISLGFFCSVASEMGKIGLRETSSPFDWIITNFEGIINCIENEFEGMLNYKNLKQHKNNPNYYVDTKYNFHFYHDFSGYVDLKKQISNVSEKYYRRSQRFLNDIKQPTLFIRYIIDIDELNYIEKNYLKIISTLKKSNSNNDLILILNDDIILSEENMLNIYKVEKDKNDSVSRKFIKKNEKLKKYLLSEIYNKDKRMYNKKNYKNKNKYNFFKRIRNLVISILNKIKTPYVHNYIYNE